MDNGKLKYRSSITTFVKALLTDAACYQDLYISGLERAMKEDDKEFREVLLEKLAVKEMACILKAREAMPSEDWDEIIKYICRHYKAYGHAAVSPGQYQSPALFLPWLASIAVCALDDIGR